MTREEEVYYNNYADLFSSAGWAQILEELISREDSYNIGSLKNEKDLYKVQGELSIIRMLLGFEQFIEQGYSGAE
tara:strand:+ start:2355 stop:2579 length:225 start_codon:yes stop_codon:yes gene_type:complete